MEYAGGGTLADYLKKCTAPLSEDEIWKYFV
jgi:serine/threonine protein kinase